MRAYLWTLGVGALCFAACAFPAIGYRDDDGSASSGTTGDGGGGAGPTTSASSGMGGEGGMPCTFGVIGSCGNGQKCAPLDEQQGPLAGTHCIDAGARGSYARCDLNTQCEDGLFCNQLWSVCQPVCNTSGECASGGTCDPTATLDAMSNPVAVPDVKTCAANCVPDSGAPCKQNWGDVACVPVTNNTWECTAGGGVPKNGTCEEPEDCLFGHGCITIGANPKECLPWCSPPDPMGNDSACAGQDACFSFSMPIFHGTTAYGFCYPTP